MSQTIVGNLAVELGMSTEEFQRALAHAQVQAQAAATKIQGQINQAGKTAGSGLNPQGLLAVSRAVDDVQYGFRGVINNIESIVTGLGGSAGVAGAATIAAVAIAAIGPKIAEIVSATGPMERLSDTLREIQNSGIQGTFLGIAAQAKATQEAFEASAKQLERLQTTKTVMVGFAFEGAISDPNSGLVTGDNPRRIFEQRVRVNELAQRAAREAFDATRQRQRIAMAGLAGNDLTTFQQDQTKLNQKLFQSAVDKMGGGKNLATALEIMNLGDQGLFGAFKEGDIEATQKVVELLGLQQEQQKVMADDYERMTGSAAELLRIEEERAKAAEDTAEFIEKEQQWFNRSIAMDEQAAQKRKARVLDRQFNEYESAVMRQDSLFAQRNSLLTNMNRSEIVGAADVFSRNLNAGQKSPELTELEKINESIKELGTLTGILN